MKEILGNLPAISFEEITVSALSSLTVPAIASSCLVTVSAGDINARWDGGDPTATSGTPYYDGSQFKLTTTGDMTNFKAIERSSSSGTPILHVTYV